jgi:serine/threonine protein kinase
MDKYTKKKIIGIGISSTVYKALDQNNNPIAIKKIKTDKISHKFRSELEIIKRIKHENILNFIDIIIKDNKIYIISELCDYSLTKIINTLNSEYDIINILGQITNGLKYLYNNNISHRDLKPDNILLLKNKIKIADFGYAKELNNNSIMMSTFCGTPYYMAPEILCSSKYNSKSDLWSLGIILYEMIYHEHPFKDIDNMIELINKFKNNLNIDYPHTEYSVELMNLLKKILIIDADKRIEWQDFFDDPIFNRKDTETYNIKINLSFKKNPSIINPGTIEIKIDNDKNICEFNSELVKDQFNNIFTLKNSADNHNITQEYQKIFSTNMSTTIINDYFEKAEADQEEKKEKKEKNKRSIFSSYYRYIKKSIGM